MPGTMSMEERIEGAMNKVSYPLWFTDQMAKGYVGTFPARFSMCKNEKEQECIMNEARVTVSLYSVLVYYTYNENEKFMKTNDSNKELSENFKMIKAWLDEREGKQAADDFLDYLKENIAAIKGAGAG